MSNSTETNKKLTQIEEIRKKTDVAPLFPWSSEKGVMPWWALLLAVAGTSWAHVKLTFPPARLPDSDYYSSANSRPPCGVPKPPIGTALSVLVFDRKSPVSSSSRSLRDPKPGNTVGERVIPARANIPEGWLDRRFAMDHCHSAYGVRTFLKAGSTVDLQWITAIPHMGGIRLEVLNSLDEPIAIFTNFLDPYNITKNGKQIALPPQFECANCAIRITHQATEYGDDYFFYSCADVNILKVAEPNEKRCVCDALPSNEENYGQCIPPSILDQALHRRLVMECDASVVDL
ncbi:hypothetical protein ANCCEY_01372 [Ancylostoma ceylanicum]|uniref:Chitin-binding type-4 domain-containing protein n=1 Tax=Ancylostoma ceylanicum TaxID=53326 RepID=A0A0D6MCV1_9BILA|nr:hypothetical protein ANCCEY_01372 [Ancylostoma ceylanicum]